MVKKHTKRSFEHRERIAHRHGQCNALHDLKAGYVTGKFTVNQPTKLTTAVDNNCTHPQIGCSFRYALPD